MKKSICFLFGLIASGIAVFSQNTSIIDDLNAAKSGQGSVTIYQEDSLNKLLGKKIINSVQIAGNYFAEQMNTSTEGVSTSSSKNFARAKGFRIQVYSGNNQRVSKNEAEARRNSIRSAFPGMDVTVSYNSPVWRVKAGHFQTREQANEALQQMKLHFPTFGREMYVINDEIKIPTE